MQSRSQRGRALGSNSPKTEGLGEFHEIGIPQVRGDGTPLERLALSPPHVPVRAVVKHHRDDADRERLATNAAAKLVEIVEWVASVSSEWPEELRGVAADVVRRAPALAALLREARHLPRGLSKTRVHGDYHLGQVLRVHEDDGRASWTIVDFEGEPLRPLAERRAKSSPLRDVAGMLRSFDYAAFAAVRDVVVDAPRAELESIARAWRDTARDEFLRGWLSLVESSDIPLVPTEPKARDEALALFELDKALYELAYEIENRPDWIAIPLRGIHALMP